MRFIIMLYLLNVTSGLNYFRFWFISGSHFVTIVTYYPSFEDDSFPATVFRIYCTIVLFMMMLSMIMTVDAFTMVNLIIFKYKIITLRRYFERISQDFKEMHKINRRLAVENLAKGLIKGFKVHKELLRYLLIHEKKNI